MQNGKIHRLSLSWSLRFYRRAALLSLFVCSAWASVLHAQTPIPAAKGPPAKPEGFTPGWGFGTRFEGSTSGDGRAITDVATGVGYNFTRHFGMYLAVPYYFIFTPSSITQTNPGVPSGNGIGNVAMDLKWNYPGHSLKYASTIHLGAPTGDKKQGFSAGRATWNWLSHFEHGWGNFAPFVEGGIGNTTPGTSFFYRPYITYGLNASFEAGAELDAGPFSFTASAYDFVPWGTQTMISSTSVQAGGAGVVRDNGFNAGIDVQLLRYLDLEVDYSRSVPLRLNTFSFVISFKIGSLLPPQPRQIETSEDAH